jgi:general secretion pathway protein K
MLEYWNIGKMGNRRGIALILTLTMTTLLVTTALELHRKVRSNVISTSLARDRLMLLEMATSGVHIGMAMLIQDKLDSPTDSLQEDWANPEKLEELLGEIPFEGGTLTLHMADEAGKIQVNALVQPPGGRTFNEGQRLIWERLLTWSIDQNESLPEIDPVAVINSLKDWMDSGDDEAITGLSGAESDYYQELEPPYSCRNGPIRHLGELLRIKDITPELFYGMDELPGISESVTVYGLTAAGETSEPYQEGRININTADLPVLISLLPVESQDIAEAMVEYRLEKDGTEYAHDLSNPKWYQEVPGLSGLQIEPALITTASDIFKIKAVAAKGGMEETVTTVVKREQDEKTGKWVCRILSWETK